MSALSPIFVEIIGTPAAGKTTLANRLYHFFQACNVDCEVAPEPAGRYPGDLSDKLRPSFNQWTLSESVSRMEDYRSNRRAEVVILDRGVVDSLYWLNWFKDAMGFNEQSYRSHVVDSFVYVKMVRKVILLTCSFDVAERRRPGGGRIMNSKVYPQLLSNYNKKYVASDIGLDLSSFFGLDTTDLQVDTVERKVRAFLNAPKGGDRNDLMAALLR